MGATYDGQEGDQPGSDRPNAGVKERTDRVALAPLQLNLIFGKYLDFFFDTFPVVEG